jgi:hypothetical protein
MNNFKEEFDLANRIDKSLEEVIDTNNKILLDLDDFCCELSDYANCDGVVENVDGGLKDSFKITILKAIDRVKEKIYNKKIQS